MPRQVNIKRSEVVPISTVQQQEIDAMKQRLATAKIQASAASKSLEASKETKNYAEMNMNIAKKMLDSANKDVLLSQNQYDISHKELQEAEKCLADAQASLQADADMQKNASDNLQQLGEDSNKKREVPPVPAVADSKQEDSIKKRKATELSSSSNNTSPISRKTPTMSKQTHDMYLAMVNAEKGIRQSIPPPSTSQSTSSSSSPIKIDQIYIKGCGNAEIDGTYNRELTLHNGAFIYTKNEEVVWQGESVFFSIYREYNSTATKFMWYIGNKPGEKALFRSDLDVNSAIPPQRGWVIAGMECGGLYPVPYCRHIRRNKTQSTTVQSNNIDKTREQRTDQIDKDSVTKHTAATAGGQRKSLSTTMTIKRGRHPSASRPSGSTVIEIGKRSSPTKTIRVEQRPSSGAAAMIQDGKSLSQTKEAVVSEQPTAAPPLKTEEAVPPLPFYDESVDWTCSCGKVVPRKKKRCSECNKWRGGKRAPYETKVSMMKKVAPATIKLDVNTNTINVNKEHWTCTNCQNEVSNTKSRCGKCHRWRGGKRKGGWKIKITDVDVSGIEWDKDWTCCDLIIPAAKKRCGKCNGWRGGKRVAAKAKKQKHEFVDEDRQILKKKL